MTLRDHDNLLAPLDITREELKHGPRDCALEADAAERGAIAHVHGLPEIAHLSAAMTAVPLPGGRIGVTGTLKADVTYECVVSLEPYTASIHEPFETVFSPGGELDQEIDPEAEADIEPLIDGRVDLAKLVLDHFSLTLDPHPQRPGAEPPVALPEPSDEAPRSPFAALKDWGDGSAGSGANGR